MAVQRISGLATGIDYETMIKDLMRVEKAPVDKLKQQKQIYKWQQEVFRDINTSLSALRTEAFNLKLSSAYKVFNTSVNTADASYISAAAASTASEGSYMIKVKQLASASEKKNTVTSSDLKSTSGITDFDVSGKDFCITFEGVQKHISWDAAETPYTTIDELKAGIQSKIDNAFGSNQITVSVADGDKIKFSAANTTFKSNITLNTGTTSDALAQLNFANNARSNINIDTQLQDLTFANGSLTFDTDDKLKFTINGSSFELDKTATLQTLFTTVNSDENADVIMGYDSSKDIIYVKRKSTGAGKDITFTDGTGSNFSAAAGLGATVQGKNAIVDFTDNNGIQTLNIEKASNNITVAGLNITLLKIDDTAEKTITVSKDVNAVYDKIKAFVDKYNETIEKLNTKVSEKREYDYLPLTDEQKEAMKETQIEQWETKAKSGLVNGDSILQGVMRDLRYAISNEIAGLNANFNQLKEFGITTGGYRENGKLKIDETKLKQAIAENPDEVMSFFSNNPQDLKGNSLNGVVDVDTKDFRITINGVTQTIALSGSYDLSTSEGKVGLVKELNDEFVNKFGYNSLVASLSSDSRIVISSPSGSSYTLNSGLTNDALGTLGFADGANYDAASKGIMVKIYDKLNTGINRIITKAGSSISSLSYYDVSLIGQQISRIDTRITQASKRLIQIEDRYYRQFQAMESAISRMNSQSAWMSQQFSSGK